MPEPVDPHADPFSAREHAWTFWKELGAPVLSAIAAILSVTVGIFASAQDVRLKEVRFQLESVEKDAAARRLERTDREALTFKLFEAVRASLASGNASEQRAVAALVTTLADSAFAVDLLGAMQQQATGEVRTEIGAQLSATREFDVVQSQASPPPPAAAPGGPAAAPSWRCDVFWATRGGGGARQLADAAQRALRREWGDFSVRVRELPDLVNARAGYRAAGYEIRHDGNELERAKRMKVLLDPLVAGRGEFKLRSVGSPTPGYLSVFVNP